MGNRGASVCSFRALVLADRPGSIHTLRAAPVTSRAPGGIVLVNKDEEEDAAKEPYERRLCQCRAPPRGDLEGGNDFDRNIQATCSGTGRCTAAQP